jgi:rhodanese-related sulfurtransferase
MVPHADVRQLAAALQGSTSGGSGGSGGPGGPSGPSGAVVLDVREPFEYASGHVPGAVHLPMHLVPLRLDEIPKDRPVYVICATGNRSWQVAHYLGQHGLQAINVDGGTNAWASAGLPIENTRREVGAGLGAAS